jgi:transcription elongation factor GreA
MSSLAHEGVEELEELLERGVVVDVRHAVLRGLPVEQGVLDDDGETVTYTIVGADESDPKRGRISSSSPVGHALVGHDAGDIVTVQTPAGERRYTILEIG